MRSEAVGIAREARDDPVLSVVLDRAEAGSLPGRRSDGCVVSLVIEGGGVRGVVSAGMWTVRASRRVIRSG